MITLQTIGSRLGLPGIEEGSFAWGFSTDAGASNARLTIEDGCLEFEITERPTGEDSQVVCDGVGVLAEDGDVVEFDVDVAERFDFFCEAVKGMALLS